MLTWVAVIASLGVAAVAAVGGIVSFTFALFRVFSNHSTNGGRTAGTKIKQSLASN